MKRSIRIVVRMKRLLRILLGTFIGTILGLIFPYVIALLNLLPFLRHDTSYEIVITYMFLSGIFGAVAGCLVAYRVALKSSASK